MPADDAPSREHGDMETSSAGMAPRVSFVTEDYSFSPLPP